jgi:DNA-binding response OmpR family regulator
MVKGSILIVDDNPANLSVLTNHLEKSDYEVLIARTGESGLVKAAYAQPDLILLDYILPGINGFEVCKRLKQINTTQKIPIIFMTSLNDFDHRLEGLRLGAVDYLNKPIREEELLLRVNTHVQLKRLTISLKRKWRNAPLLWKQR